MGKRYFVVGSNGTIGMALVGHLPKTSVNISGATIREWFSEHGEFSPKGLDDPPLLLSPDYEWVMINCIGLTNPRAGQQELMRINYEIPLKILESFKGQISTFVNFGSVLENYVLSSTNGYLKSKKMLANALKDWKQEIRILDFKLHTVYGGLTNPPHMLVGHLERIIRERSVLLLSSGKQIREYHHVDDLVPALVEYIEEEESSGEIAVNTGQSLRIREMVFDVMKEFRLEKKLQFDRLDDPVDDNYSDFTQPTSWTTKFHFREPIPGITEYLKFRIGN